MSNTKTPASLEVGRRLVEYCRNENWAQAIDELYADHARHVEAFEMSPDMPRVTEGKEKIVEMSKWWDDNHEVHDCKITGPYPHGDDRFALVMAMDVTPKAGPMQGQRHTMEEVCLYHVADDKIIQADFFWDPTGYGE